MAVGTTLGLPSHWRQSRALRCGCKKTATRYDAFCVTEIDVKGGCHKHDPGAPRLRAGMSKALRFDILERDNFTCQYCGRRAPHVELEIDHVIAVAKGGSSTVDNLVTACSDCNRGKRDR